MTRCRFRARASCFGSVLLPAVSGEPHAKIWTLAYVSAIRATLHMTHPLPREGRSRATVATTRHLVARHDETTREPSAWTSSRRTPRERCLNVRSPGERAGPGVRPRAAAVVPGGARAVPGAD